jgi:copper oxidase (laccase) domain-containing protein
VAGAHAGWRGLAAGVIEAPAAALPVKATETLLAWLGPAIGPQAFEVGPEVGGVSAARRACRTGREVASCFARPETRIRVLADLRQTGRAAPRKLGMHSHQRRGAPVPIATGRAFFLPPRRRDRSHGGADSSVASAEA